MKWFIASDIHGSSFWCRKMLEAYDAEGADRLLILGDVLYHGPRNDLPLEYAPKEVIALLNERKDSIFCVRGNCDTEVDQMVLDFPILADYMLLDGGEKVIFATHGHRFNKESMPPLKKGDILLHGHTHIPVCEDIYGITYCNPGSVSIPKAGSENGYMIFEDSSFRSKTFSGQTYKRYEF